MAALAWTLPHCEFCKSAREGISQIKTACFAKKDAKRAEEAARRAEEAAKRAEEAARRAEEAEKDTNVSTIEEGNQRRVS